MANYFKNSDVNSFKDSDVNNWKISDFYIKTKISAFWEEPYAITEETKSFWEEIYSLADYITKFWEEKYGIPLSIFWEEPYGDVLMPLHFSEEYYGDTILPFIFSEEIYHDVEVLEIFSEEIYNITAPASLFSEESYSITEHTIQTFFVEEYNLEVFDKLELFSEEYYHLLSANTIYNEPIASLSIAGEEIDFLSLNFSANLSQYCIICGIELPTEVEYSKCQYEQSVILTINGTDFVLFVDNRQSNTSNKGINYSISLVSPTAKLDAPYSKTIIATYPDGIYTQDLIQEMADLQGITVDYQIRNWFLPSYAIAISDETPLAVIKRVAQAVKGVVQTKPNGDLLIIKKYPTSPTQWGESIPLIVYAPDINAEEITETLRITTNHNAFIISSGESSSASITLEEETINEHTKIIRGFRVPFEDGEFELETSGGLVISMEKYSFPIEEERPIEEDWEIIEFIDWVGSTSSPIYDIIDYDWIEEDLGDLNNSAEFQILEDGTLTALNQDIVPSESLLRIRYITKFWQWTVRCAEDKEVQFYVPEEV